MNTTSRPTIKIIQDKKGRTYLYVNGEFAGFVIDNGYMPLAYTDRYSAMVDGKAEPVDTVEGGILALLLEFCIIEGVYTP